MHWYETEEAVLTIGIIQDLKKMLGYHLPFN